MIDDVHAGDGRQQDLRAQLLAAVQLRTGFQRATWGAAGMFWATNAGLLIALFASGDLPHPLAGAVVSGAGFVLSLACWLLVRQGAGRVRAYDVIIERIESRLNMDRELALSRGGKLGEGATLSIGGLIGISTAGAAALWLVALALFVYQSLLGFTEAPAAFWL